MEDWKKACGKALWLSLELGIDSPDLVAALQKSDADAAALALSPFILMLEGARRVLEHEPGIYESFHKQAQRAKEAAMKAFELVSSVGCPPEDPNLVCALDG